MMAHSAKYDFFAKAQIGRWAVPGLRERAQRAGHSHDFLCSGGERGRVGGNWVEMLSAPSLESCDSSFIAKSPFAASPKIARQKGGAFHDCRAFTLVELLVVIVVIGMLASITIPALKGFGQSNTMAAANRQLLDDLSFARASALNNRTDVYFLFPDPEVLADPSFVANLKDRELGVTTQLMANVYSSYGVYAKRRAGDQPGRENPWYLLEWKNLPQGVFFSPDIFKDGNTNTLPNLDQANIRFPTSEGKPEKKIRGFVFTSRGRLDSPTEIRIPLTRGSIFPARDAQGNLIPGEPDLVETPPNNSTDNFNRLVIDHITGRARVERPEVE